MNTPIIRKPTAVFHQTGRIEVGHGKITGRDRPGAGRTGRAVGAGLPFPAVPDDAESPQAVRRQRPARDPAGRHGDRRRPRDRQPDPAAQPLAQRHGAGAGAARRGAGRPSRADRRLPRQHALYRPRLVHPRPARLEHGVHPDREDVPAAQGAAGVPAGLADRLHALHHQPPAGRAGAGDRQLRDPSPVRLAGLRAACRSGSAACPSSPSCSWCCWSPTWCSTGPTAPTTRCRCCGASMRCITAPSTWTGWRARGCICSSC